MTLKNSQTDHRTRDDIVFEPDFSAARRGDGTTTKFTRLEKRALSIFAASAGRLLTRNQLLDAISEPGSEKSDRTIDFLINRLRRKLGDDARTPRFIETRYGEGYVWLPLAYSDSAAAAFIVIGPLKGVVSLGKMGSQGIALARMLQSSFREGLRADEKVAIVADLAIAEMPALSRPQIGVQLTFFRQGADVECVVSARRLVSGHIFEVRRFPVRPDADGYQALSVVAQHLAQSIIARYWQVIATDGSASSPLPIAMHDAAQLPDYEDSWSDTDKRLHVLKRDYPDDPAIKLMWATHLHTKYVRNGTELFQAGTDTCIQDEREIERLVLESIEYAQSRPEFAVMAAKLLYFVDHGYRDLAMDLALAAHGTNTAIASSLAIVGQLYAFSGDIETAEDYLSQAEQLCEPGSEFHVYTLYFQCQAHMANGNREKLATSLKRLYRIRPGAVVYLEPFFTDPETPSLRARAMVRLISRPKATAMLKHATYISARLFKEVRHRENSLLTPVNLFVRRFGYDVVPDEAAIHLSAFHSP